jgi:hypothetical protein
MRNLVFILSICAAFVAGSAVVHSNYDVVQAVAVKNEPIKSLNSSPVCELIQRQFKAQYNDGKNIDLSSSIRDAFTDERGTTTVNLNNSVVLVRGGKRVDVTNPFQTDGVRWAKWTISRGFNNRWESGGYKTSIIATADNILPKPGHILALTIGGWGWRGYVYRVYSVPKAQWGSFLKSAKTASPNSTFGFKPTFATKVYPGLKLNKFANIFTYDDKLFYIEENEDENTRVTTYQLNEKDGSKLVCKIERVNKILPDGRWIFKEKLLTSYCFSRVWISLDNYQFYEEEFGRDQNFDEFMSRPGKYIGGAVPVELTRLPDWGNPLEVSLPKRLSNCVDSDRLHKKNDVKIIVEDGLVVSKFPKDKKFGYINYPIKYRLLKRITLKHCQRFAPHLFKDCVDLGLVEITEESGGSIGIIHHIGIYGIFKNTKTRKAYVIPLINLDNLSNSMDYIARLEK